MEPALLAPKLLPEVRAARGEVVVPARPGPAHDGVRLPPDEARADAAVPAGPGKGFTDEDVPLPARDRERLSQQRRRSLAVLRRGDRTELVGGPEAEKARLAHVPPAGDDERHDGDQRPIRAAAGEEGEPAGDA